MNHNIRLCMAEDYHVKVLGMTNQLCYYMKKTANHSGTIFRFVQ